MNQDRMESLFNWAMLSLLVTMLLGVIPVVLTLPMIMLIKLGLTKVLAVSLVIGSELILLSALTFYLRRKD